MAKFGFVVGLGLFVVLVGVVWRTESVVCEKAERRLLTPAEHLDGGS
jgi:hypothetical protein